MNLRIIYETETVRYEANLRAVCRDQSMYSAQNASLGAEAERQGFLHNIDTSGACCSLRVRRYCGGADYAYNGSLLLLVQSDSGDVMGTSSEGD